MRFITLFFIFIIILAIIDTVRRVKIAKIKNEKKKYIFKTRKK